MDEGNGWPAWIHVETWYHCRIMWPCGTLTPPIWLLEMMEGPTTALANFNLERNR